MATELGKAYVQIIPSAKGISGSISEAIGGEATSAGKSAGLNLVGALKGVIAAAGIGAAIKSSLDAGGALQQSFGGLDTIYGDASKAAKEFAAEAYKAGISMNTYSEQAVSFGASLKQAYGGDTVKAVEAANVAIMDMADNSAKMGTDISSVQNAYQGFAKQNYTMLDNLKLGYGGTKKEMERLLEDATKLSGVEYNIENLGDVYQAIHVIQEDLGLTGVAAAEAEGTFTGSMGAMKASAENLLANLALGNSIEEDIKSLSGNLQAFVFNNLMPMVSNILNALPTLVEGVSGIIIQGLNMITQHAPEIAQQGVQIVTSLVEAVISALPYLVEAAVNLALAFGDALIHTDWITVGNDLITSLRESIDLAAGEILGMDTATIDGFLAGISNALPGVLEKGSEMVMNVANGILKNLPTMIRSAGELVIKFTDFIMSNYPVILEKGFELVKNLASGIVSNLPEIGKAALEVMVKLLATIAQNLPQILQTGITVILELVAGLLKAIPKIIAAIPQIISAIKDTFSQYDWSSIGHNILEGIKNGIMNSIWAVVDAAREAANAIWDGVVEFFEIGSPSKRMAWVGEMYDEGLAFGIEKNADVVSDATDGLMDDMLSEMATPSPVMNFTNEPQAASNMTINMNIYGAEGQSEDLLAEIIQEKLNQAVRSKELVYA